MPINISSIPINGDTATSVTLQIKYEISASSMLVYFTYFNAGGKQLLYGHTTLGNLIDPTTQSQILSLFQGVVNDTSVTRVFLDYELYQTFIRFIYWTDTPFFRTLLLSSLLATSISDAILEAIIGPVVNFVMEDGTTKIQTETSSNFRVE